MIFSYPIPGAILPKNVNLVHGFRKSRRVAPIKRCDNSGLLLLHFVNRRLHELHKVVVLRRRNSLKGHVSFALAAQSGNEIRCLNRQWI
jgi:hypothetical protein